jgi:hypothetical protein
VHPPVADSVALYATPIVPLARLAVVIVSAAMMTKFRLTEAVFPVLSVACTATLYDPAVDGVPEIVPVLVPKLSPCGSWPEVIDQL